jgi:uncharacterized SAM-binding protein YcdF (DUF218 family)
MLFTLKKIISFFLMPLSIGFVLLLVALYFLLRNQQKKAKRFLLIGIVWFFLISFAPLSNLLVQPLESQYAQNNHITQEVQYILLLGGDFENRAYEALKHYHALENVKIITSGYEGHKKISDAQYSKSMLEQIGVKTEDIIMQSMPKDTHEEALAVKKIVQDKPFILVTSALHMPRAMLLFKNEGLNPIAAPTDFLYDEEAKFYHISAKQMLITQKAMHEYIGIVYSLLKDVILTFKGLFT